MVQQWKNRIERDYSCGLAWFGSVAEMQTANQTKPNRAVQCKSHPN